MVTNSVNIARCTAGRCSHTFEPPSNPPSSYDSVSVVAENVVGVGAARTCTAQTISELTLSFVMVFVDKSVMAGIRLDLQSKFSSIFICVLELWSLLGHTT